MTTLLNDRDIEFLLYEVLDTEKLFERERYQEHTRETVDAVLDTAKTIAEKYFANHYKKADENEPSFDGEKVNMIPETKEAWDAFAEAGFLAAHYDFDEGGLQMPEIVLRTAMAYFYAANVPTATYPMLTLGSAGLIRAFAKDEYKEKYLPPMMDGRFSGTMALTEPDQGSALADIRTYAEPQDDGTYRIFGQKIFISGGDQSITDNIIHLALAKIKGAPAGVKGISLFIVPKFLVNDDGSLGERNDVQLAGLLHKMGWRNTTSTALSFGEKDGAIGYLVGEPHKGLAYMFQMMNEARIGVALTAACLGYQGYNHSLDYARNRPQGRLPSNKDPLSKQVMLTEHADIRRLLLAQKAYTEGSLFMCLYASALFEDTHTLVTEEERQQAWLLLDFLIPMVKSFPSKYCPEANDMAIQILGGSGYIREYPVEQYYRDNRLNPIHEGTEGIQAIDLLGRKVIMKDMAGYKLFKQTVEETLQQAQQQEQTQAYATKLRDALELLDETTENLMQGMQADKDKGLANATIYLDMMGRIVMSWLWLKQAVQAVKGLDVATDEENKNFYQGKLQAAKYYIEWELPEIKSQAALLQSQNMACFEMKDEWF